MLDRIEVYGGHFYTLNSNETSVAIHIHTYIVIVYT